MIPYGRQQISESDIDAVVDVLRSDFLTQGPVVPEFEKSILEYCGAKYAIAVSNATSALHLACLALGVSSGDIVWTTPITFVATANCALYCGATIDFVDIDPISYNINIECLSEKLEYARKHNCLPKVLIPVHLCGNPCDMKSIYELSKQYGFKVVEDASHAIGGKYCGEPIGNCKYSDITVFSFHPVKIITTAEGGVALTNNVDLAKKIELLRSHGITRDLNEMDNQPDGPWYYEQIALGYNYRMTDLQAALGLSQLAQLDHFVSLRHQIANKYSELLKSLPLRCPIEAEYGYSSFHLYVIRLKLAEIHKSHLEIFKNLRAKGIGVNLHYIPIYHQPFYKKLGFQKFYCKNAEDYYAEAISLPIFPSLKSVDQEMIVNSIKEAILT